MAVATFCRVAFSGQREIANPTYSILYTNLQSAKMRGKSKEKV